MHRPIYLYVTPFFPSPDNWRGAYCYDFVREMMRLNKFNVAVFMPGDGADYEMGGIRVHTFRIRLLLGALFPFFFSASNVRSFLAAVQRAGIALDDIAVCHANTGHYQIYANAIKARNPKCLTLLHHHDLSSFGLTVGCFRHCWLYNMMLFPILRREHEKVDCHVFISEASRKSFLAAPDTSWTDFSDYKRQMRGLPYRPARIKRSVILHNGVDTTMFHPLSRPRPRTSTSFTIGCIGNFEVLKDQATLIKAVGLLKEPVKVIFVGTGPTLDTCKKLTNSIVDLHLQPTPIFEFRTEVPHERLPDFYRSLDLFVLPSCFEGFGCVYTEAAACGVPFIGVKGQGIADVADDDWLIEPHDVNGLAKKIAWVVCRRPTQTLKAEVGITPLVAEFVRKIERMRKEITR